jgi:hypothetical protein
VADRVPHRDKQSLVDGTAFGEVEDPRYSAHRS